MMMRTIRMAAALALVQASLLGCGEGAGRITAPEDARLDVGPTSRVAVTCPSRIKPGQTAQCTALGYDANNNYTNSNVTSWSSTSTAKVTVSSSGVITAVATGTSSVRATIDGVIGSVTVTVEPNIWIDGPSLVRASQDCSYFAEVTSGTSPYTYAWSVSGGTGTQRWDWGEPWTFTARTSSSMTITLTVTDASGVSATVTKSVTASSSAPAFCVL